LKRLLHLASFALTSLPIIVIARFWRPHVVIVVVPTLFCVPNVLLAMAGSSAKRVLHVQDLELDAAFDLGLIKREEARSLALKVERSLLRRFDRVTSVSRRMLKRLSAKGVESDRLTLFPNWVDTDQIKPAPGASFFRCEWGIKPRSIVLLYSGALGEKQGVEILFQAAQRLEANPSIQLVVCSAGPAFKRFRNEYSLLSNVIWHDLVPENRLNDLLNLADIHLLPQRADAADLVMPSKLTGMLASGRPVIATAVEGTQVAEAVEGRGIVVPPGDVDGLVGAVERLAADASFRQSLGEAARKYALENLDKKLILKRFEEDLVSLVSGDTR
jgi:colanic acid biosynthesis glycosyl transferase WcaI